MEEKMQNTLIRSAVVFICLVLVCSPLSFTQEKPAERMIIVGEYVRQVVNNEALVNVGYRTAHATVGNDWMLLEIGMTVLKGNRQTLQRGAISLISYDDKVVPLATQSEYGDAGYLRMLNSRANRMGDSVNYFPPEAHIGCRIGFFSDPTNRMMSFDQIELSSDRGCFGRVYFKIPETMKHGPYVLHVQFEKTLLQVPFKLRTDEEQKAYRKKLKELRDAEKKKKDD